VLLWLGSSWKRVQTRTPTGPVKAIKLRTELVTGTRSPGGSELDAGISAAERA
jgi:hypothetical protein